MVMRDTGSIQCPEPKFIFRSAAEKDRQTERSVFSSKYFRNLINIYTIVEVRRPP